MKIEPSLDNNKDMARVPATICLCLAAVSTVHTGSCPAGWTWRYEDDTCYILVKVLPPFLGYNFDQAVLDCQGKGGRLASSFYSPDADFAKFISDQMNPKALSVWLGEVSYSNRGDIRPAYVCSTRAVATECPRGWTKFPTDDRCYREFDQSENPRYLPLTYTQAVQACYTQGAGLAAPKTQEVNAYISRFQGANSTWISLTNGGQNGTNVWTWEDGDGVVYSNWEAGHPNNAYSSCAMLSGGTWTDVSCDSKLPYVCSRSSIEMPNSDVIG